MFNEGDSFRSQIRSKISKLLVPRRLEEIQLFNKMSPSSCTTHESVILHGNYAMLCRCSSTRHHVNSFGNALQALIKMFIFCVFFSFFFITQNKKTRNLPDLFRKLFLSKFFRGLFFTTQPWHIEPEIIVNKCFESAHSFLFLWALLELWGPYFVFMEDCTDLIHFTEKIVPSFSKSTLGNLLWKFINAPKLRHNKNPLPIRIICEDIKITKSWEGRSSFRSSCGWKLL